MKRPCKPGCGKRHKDAHGASCIAVDPTARYWCSKACRDARKPQGPRKPTDGPTKPETGGEG